MSEYIDPSDLEAAADLYDQLATKTTVFQKAQEYIKHFTLEPVDIDRILMRYVNSLDSIESIVDYYLKTHGIGLPFSTS